MSAFEDLIQNLGSTLGISLQAEQDRFCKITFESGLSLQIEKMTTKEYLLVSSYLCEVPPGAFREDVLIKALKANHDPESLGSFAYLDKNNNLVLELYLPPSIDANTLAGQISQFVEKGLKWKEAVCQGRISLIENNSGLSLPFPFSTEPQKIL
jgi:hypothetical protein